jgi:hypothetical protein
MHGHLGGPFLAPPSSLTLTVHCRGGLSSVIDSFGGDEQGVDRRGRSVGVDRAVTACMAEQVALTWTRTRLLPAHRRPPRLPWSEYPQAGCTACDRWSGCP